MKEEEIEHEVLIANFERYLPPDEREAGSELEEKALNMVNEGLLDFALSAQIGGAEEVEKVRILEHLRCHVRIRGRKRGLEVGEGSTVAEVRSPVDLKGQDIARPSVLACRPDVPFPD